MYELVVRRKFDAAHYLRGYAGDCANLHGHTWQVELRLRATQLLGDMLVDFKVVKRRLDDILPDHKCLNEVYFFNPTAENLAKHFYDEFEVPDCCCLVSVTVWESADCGATYYGDTRKKANCQ